MLLHNFCLILIICWCLSYFVWQQEKKIGKPVLNKKRKRKGQRPGPSSLFPRLLPAWASSPASARKPPQPAARPRSPLRFAAATR